MASNSTQEGERQDQQPLTATNPNRSLPQSLGNNIDEEDISLPLSLIKGLRHHKGENVKSGTAAADSLSSSNTSDKDDSGGDETGGSNTSSGAKMGASVTLGAFGPMSSLSGSEPNDGSNSSGSRTGILRKNGNNASKSDSMSTSSSSEDIAGDELSTRVVARAKSVSNSESCSHQQPQSIKVSFAPEKLCTGEGRGGSVGSDSNNAVAPAVISTKRKNEVKASEQKDSSKKARTSVSLPHSTSRVPPQITKQQARSFNSVAMVSSASSNTGSGVVHPIGQASSINAVPAKNRNSNQSKSLGSPAHESSKFPGSLQQQNKQLTSEERRLERNQREKERSNRIASQVDTLRTLLQRGGLYIPKNTKSTVLTEASNYIRTLQDRQQLMNMEMENLKDQLLKTVAARQGLQAGGAPFQTPQDQSRSNDPSKTDAHDYYLIFNNSMAGMAVASMGGALLDCNSAFRLETGLSIKEDSGTTIFNIVHPQDLTRALELISHMVDTGYNGNGNGNNRSSSPHSSGSNSDEPVFIRSSFSNRPDLGLCITLVRSEDNVARCFNITLVKNVGSNGEEFNPSLPAVPSMVPQISATSSEASKDQEGELKAQESLPQSIVPNAPIQPHGGVPQQVLHQRTNPGIMNNVVLNNPAAPVPQPAITPVIPTVNAGVGGAAAVLPPQLMQIIQQLQQQQQQQQHPPAQQQQINPQLFNLAQYQQQLQQIPIQNQYNIGNALQGTNLAMAGQPTSNAIQNNVNGSNQQEQKGNDETNYHFASG